MSAGTGPKATSRRASAVGRPDTLERVLGAARDFLAARVAPGTPPGDAAAHIFEALVGATGDVVTGEAAPLPPAHRHLSAALDRAHAAPDTAPLAKAFAALQPSLNWVRRPDSKAHGATFSDGHANAWLAGPLGLEQRSDVLVGASLVAPGVRYIDHRHPPEELYIVLSEGEWYREDRGWHTPGVGGIVYNPPNVVHAVRAGPEPLLALWLLPVG